MCVTCLQVPKESRRGRQISQNRTYRWPRPNVGVRIWILVQSKSSRLSWVPELSLQPQGMSFISLWGLEGCYRAAAKQVRSSTSPSFHPCSLPTSASLLSTSYFLCIITYTSSLLASSVSCLYKHTHCLIFVAPDLSTSSWLLSVYPIGRAFLVCFLCVLPALPPPVWGLGR